MATVEESPKNLPKQKRKRFEMWKKRVYRAERKLHDMGGDVKSGQGWWKAMIDFYGGKQWGDFELPQNDQVTSNLVKSSVDAMRPMLYFRNPRVNLEVENPSLATEDAPVIDQTTGEPVFDEQGLPVLRFRKGDPIALIGGQWVPVEQQVELLESIDNYYLDKMDCDCVMKRIITDALVLPYGVAKLEYKMTFRDQGEYRLDGDKGSIQEVGEKARVKKSEGPQMRRVKPWLFLWDSNLDEFDLKQAHWVCEIYYLSEEDIQRDPFLSKAKRPAASHQAADLMTKSYEEQFEGHQKPDKDRWKVYEIHDLKDDQLKVFFDGADDFARDEVSPYEMVKGSVYTLLGFDESIDSAFPISLTASVKSKAVAYNKMLSYMVRHIRRFNRKYKTLEGTLTNPDELERFLHGADGTNVFVNNMQGGPDPINDAPISQDVYRMGSTIKQEVTEEIGVSAFRRAGREPGVETAYEASLIEGGSDVKIEDKRNTVRFFMRTLIRKLNAILKIYITDEQAIRIAGIEGVHWRNWRGTDIEGEFIEDVDIYSELPFNKVEDQRRVLELYSIMAQDPYVDPLVLRKKVAKAFDLPEGFVLSPADLSAQQAQGQPVPGQPSTEADLAERQELNRQNASQGIRPQPTLRERSEGALRQPDLAASILGRGLGGAS